MLFLNLYLSVLFTIFREKLAESERDVNKKNSEDDDDGDVVIGNPFKSCDVIKVSLFIEIFKRFILANLYLFFAWKERSKM